MEKVGETYNCRFYLRFRTIIVKKREKLDILHWLEVKYNKRQSLIRYVFKKKNHWPTFSSFNTLMGSER